MKLTHVTNANVSNPPHGLEATQDNLAQLQASIAQQTQRHVQESGEQVMQAGDAATKAYGALVGAAANAVGATVFAGIGTAEGAVAGAHLVGAGALAGLGGVTFLTEAARDEASSGLKQGARGLLHFRNFLEQVQGGDTQLGLQETAGDSSYVRLSHELYGGAKDQVSKAGGDAAAMVQDYRQSLDNALAAGVGTVAAGAYVVDTGTHLAEAAGQLGIASADQLASLSVGAAELAVELSREGIQGTEVLLEIAAQAQVDLANTIGMPDKGQAQIVSSDALAKAQTELTKFAAANPGAADKLNGLLQQA